MMKGGPLTYYNKILVDFGTYVQVLKDNNPTNTKKLRTTPAIALNQTGNAQGGYFFMSLVTGPKLNRK